MRRAWILYNALVLLLISFFVLLDIITNTNRSNYNLNMINVQIAMNIVTVGIILTPIWIILLIVYRSKLDKKSFLVGLFLWGLTILVSVYPILSTVGLAFF